MMLGILDVFLDYMCLCLMVVDRVISTQGQVWRHCCCSERADYPLRLPLPNFSVYTPLNPKPWTPLHNPKPCTQVWPGMAVYPDYLSHPNITAWLTRQLRSFYNEVPFDGLWLDMSEPSNFCTGLNCRMDPNNATAKFCE